MLKIHLTWGFFSPPLKLNKNHRTVLDRKTNENVWKILNNCVLHSNLKMNEQKKHVLEIPENHVADWFRTLSLAAFMYDFHKKIYSR